VTRADPPRWHAHLASSGLTPADAKALRLKWLTPAAATTLLQTTFPLETGGIHFPYFALDGSIDPAVCRVRLLPDPANGVDPNTPTFRYLQPPGTPPRVYFPRTVDWATLAKDTTARIVITEGEKKAAAACKAGIPCLGLGGVWSFQQKDLGVPLLADLAAIEWAGRQVVLAYDSDWSEKKEVRQAAAVLARRLAERGAEVRSALLSSAPGGGKVGVDDLLVARGAKALHAVLDSAPAITPEHAETADYRARFTLVKTLSAAWDRETGTLYARRRMEDSFPDEMLQTVGPTGRPTQTTKAQYWWQDPTKTSASSLVLEPGEPEITAKGDLNQFRGWGTTPERGSTEVWQKLLHSLFQGRKDLIRWFEQWCAYPLQHPGAKLHTSVFVYGGQGVGKTAAGLVLLDIYGASGRLIQDREIFSSFNGWIGETLFCLGDDLAFEERKKSRSVIKMLTDSETIEINEKYLPSYRAQNRCQFFFNANRPDALPLDPTGLNRRFMVIEAPTARPFPTTWYTKTFHEWRHQGNGSAHVHDRLLRMDLKGFHAYADAPHSDAKALVVATGQSGVEAWVGELTNHTEMALATVRELYDLYRSKTQDTRTGIGAFTASLRAVAEPLGTQRVAKDHLSLWAIRAPEHWKKTKPKTRAERYLMERGRT